MSKKKCNRPECDNICKNDEQKHCSRRCSGIMRQRIVYVRTSVCKMCSTEFRRGYKDREFCPECVSNIKSKKQNKEKSIKITKKCDKESCNNECRFGAKQKYCSRACALHVRWGTEPNQPRYTCVICEKMFYSVRHNKTCSKECHSKLKTKNLKGRIFSEEHRKKIGAANKGRKLTYEQRRAKSCPGPKNGRWIDGRSKLSNELEYFNFTKTRKREIRERDGNVCQICFSVWVNKKGGHLHVHHIDGDKKNDKNENFITLCGSCHSLVHGVASPENGNIKLFEELRTKISQVMTNPSTDAVCAIDE